MSNASEKKHEHKGMSSRDMLDARKILKDIGLKRAINSLMQDAAMDISP